MVNNKLWSVVLVCAMVLGSQDVWAKRLGGGLSFGKQSGNVTQRSSTLPAQQAAPAPAQTAAVRPAAAGTAAPAAAAPKRAWGGMLGGFAAGLGLAWLASSLGLGEGFAQFLMFALLAAVVIAVVGMLMRRRSSAAPSGLAYQAADGGGNSQFDPATPRGYSPKNVGNDASARPWESHAGASEAAAGGSSIGSSLSGSQGWGVPADFDAEGFLKASKANFLSLQEAWDRSDIPSLRAMMTDGMLEQIQSQLSERERSGGSTVNKTEVVMLDAHLLGIEETDASYMASVEFSGLIREDVSAGPNPFREVWNITRPKSGSGGWLVAGVQALQ
ncbi:Tim44 domain-containing protein [Hydrogenophaga sp.]|uniref:Tim44 domain-containing protein n=1 Tax=Hydrogenophaga sp. TaxID=1904254 RepID=UPI003F6D99A6